MTTHKLLIRIWRQREIELAIKRYKGYTLNIDYRYFSLRDQNANCIAHLYEGHDLWSKYERWMKLLKKQHPVESEESLTLYFIAKHEYSLPS